MKEMRYSLVVIALLVGALILSGMGPLLTANVVSGRHTHVSSKAGMWTGTESVHFRPFGICPDGGPDDC